MKHRPSTRARLGIFVLDVRTGELRGDGNRILLPQQVFQVLQVLAERERDLVTRDELKKMLWPNDTVVEFEHGINNTIKKLRRALGDSADEPKYIETIPRRGYRLMVPVEWIGSSDSSSAEESSGSADGSGATSDSDTESIPKAKLKGGRLTGKVVSHYRVLDVIGGGGMGLVYRAEDLKLGRAVALKFLPEEVGDDPKAHERFDREARAVSALSHPNICPIYEFAEHDGQPFIVMELLQGKTLRDHLANGRFRLTEPEAFEIAIQIAYGLEAAHEKGIIHRDIKPANIFITDRNVAKILDFGVAKVTQLAERAAAVILSDDAAPCDGEESKASYSDDDEGIEVLRLRSSALGGLTPLRVTTEKEVGSLSMAGETGVAASPEKREPSLTRTGTMLGTAGYMSPEQIRGEPLDARSDIFSFGLVLYEMATGERAFTGETEAILHEAIMHHEPKPVLLLAPKISPRMAGIVDRCLEKGREQRFQGVTQLRIALTELQRAESLALPSTPGNDEQMSRRKRWIAVVATAAILISIIGAIFYQRTHLAPKLTDKDTIIIGDFANLTGDRLFDNAFKDVLEAALGQTPFLNPLSAEKVSQILKVMKKPPDEHLTPAIAREVCQRTQSAAYVTGSISDAGNQYQLELKAIECKTDRTLASASAQAAEQNQIVARLGDASYSLREKLGEPAASLQRFNKPLAEATTASIEALQALAAAGLHYGNPEAVSDLKRATELDPEFALGYLGLGRSYNMLRQSDRRDENLAKAYRLRERRLSHREQFEAETEYYWQVTGEYDKVIGAAEKAIQEFPRWPNARNQLGRTLSLLGDYERSASELREAVRLSTDSLPRYWNLARCYVAMDRLQDARSLLDQAEARIPDKWQLRTMSYVVAFLQNDRKTMDEVVRWAQSKPQAADLVLKEQSETAAYYGRMREAGQFMGQAAEVAVKAGAFERVADWKSIEALRLARIGETARARKLTQEALSANSSLQAKVMRAMAFAKAGDTTQALQLEQELREKYPLNLLLRDRDLPSIQAEIYLQQGKPDLAIAALERAVPYELGASQQFGADAVYVRGEAYLQAGNGQEAAAQFRRILDHPGLLANSINGPLARLQLARAQAMMGDKDAARKSYQDFLTLWRDADPYIPIYREAKAEYNKLQATSN